MDRRTDGRTKRGVESRSMRLKTGFLSVYGIVQPGIVKVSTFSYALGLYCFQNSNFTKTGSGVPIIDVILRHLALVKLIFDARFGFYVENYVIFSRA